MALHGARRIHRVDRLSTMMFEMSACHGCLAHTHRERDAGVVAAFHDNRLLCMLQFMRLAVDGFFTSTVVQSALH